MWFNVALFQIAKLANNHFIASIYNLNVIYRSFNLELPFDGVLRL